MRLIGTLNLLLVALLVWIAVSTPVVASPTVPKMPSTLNYQPLNVVPVPTTEAEWNFELGHLDIAVASGHLSGLRARNCDAVLLSYQLLHSVLITDTSEQDQLASIATARGKDIEDAFLHYYDDTTLKYSDGRTVTIKGYGGGTAATLREARIRNFIWSDDRYIYNLKSSLVSELKGTMYRTVLTSALRPDGIFVDENSPLQSFIEQPTVGGHIREYANKTRDEAAAEYITDMSAIYTAVNQAMGHDGSFGDRYLIPNVAEWVDMFLDLALHAADGAATEILIQEMQPRSPHFYNQAKQYADAGKIFLTTQGGYAPTITDPGNYNSAMDRHQMFSLGEYWIAKQGNSTYYSQYPSDFVPLSQWWCKAREYNLGVSVDPLYSIWQTGTDSVGQTCTIYKRTYTKALVLSRPRIGWTFSDYSTRSQLYPLGGTYRLLHSDGTLGPDITSIGLAMGEAATLISTGTPPPPDTIAPVISGITPSSVTSSTATVAFTTNEPATGLIEYGPSASYGYSAPASVLTTSQSVALTGLTPSTTYHYRASAMDPAGNRSVSADFTFITLSGAAGTPIDGFIKHWAVLGSFNGPGHNTDYIGETTIHPSLGDITATKSWIDFTSTTDKLDLYPLFTPKETSIAYLNVYVYSPTERACQVRIGVDDAAKVFLNGILVDDNTGYRSPEPDTDKADITLKLGWNQLLVKVENYTIGWTLYARFTDTAGNAIPDLTSQVNYPAGVGATTPKISVTITVDKQMAKSGEQLTYTVSYTNTGDGPAASAIVSADVDRNVTFVSATSGGIYNAQANAVRWNVGTVLPGMSASVRYTVVVK